MVDMLLLLLLPSSGDELQGIKKGIVERADLIIVNKSDRDRIAAARRTRSDYAGAIKLVAPMDAKWKPKVELCSAQDGTGMEAIWKDIEQYCAVMRESGAFEARRASQEKLWHGQ